MTVDSVITVGSPGMLGDDAAQLNLDPNARVYATGLGSTRARERLRPSSIGAHRSYSADGYPALANIGAFIAGMPPPQALP